MISIIIHTYKLNVLFILFVSFSSIITKVEANKLALLIGVGEYLEPEFASKPLNAYAGVNLVKNVLLDHGFNENNIWSLVNEKATYYSILELKNVFQNYIKSGDIVVFYFYGHGTQVNDLNNDEVDKLDEAFIPYDGQFRSKNEYNNLLVDDELGKWIEQFQSRSGKDGQVFVILDACHSGSGIRGANSLKTVKYYSNKLFNFDKIEGSPVIALYSSIPQQNSFEVQIENNERCALLTWAFCRALSKINLQTSYKTLFEEIKWIMALKSRKQTPLIEGRLDLQVFGETLFPNLNYFKASAILGSKNILVSSGIFDGIQPYSDFVLFPLGTTDTSGIVPLAHGKVVSEMLKLTECSIFIDKVLPDTLILQSQIYLTEKKYSNVKISMYLDIKNEMLKKKLEHDFKKIMFLKLVDEQFSEFTLKQNKNKLILYNIDNKAVWKKDYFNDHYEISIGSSTGLQDVLNWSAIPAQNFNSQSGLVLTKGSIYFPMVRAVDKNGNFSQPIYGDGWVATTLLSLLQPITTIITGETATISLAGGEAPYIFNDSGSGYINTTSGVYTAPLNINPFIETVTGLDGVGQIATSQIKVRAFELKDSFKLDSTTPLNNATAYSIAMYNANTIFSVGYGYDAYSIAHWLVRKSTDAGATWALVDDYQLIPGKYSTARKVRINSSGDIFVIGSANDNTSTHGIVRRSQDGGSTWTTIDDYQLSSGKSASCNDLSFDGVGNIYIVGYGYDATNYGHWILRKSTNGGVSWAVVDDFSYTATFSSSPDSIHIDNSGNIFVAGRSGEEAK